MGFGEVVLGVGQSFEGCYEETVNDLNFKLTFTALLLGDLTGSFQIVESEDVLELGVGEHDGAGTVGLAGFNLLDEERLELVLRVKLLVADKGGEILNNY